jgi:hypothetical protein
VVLKDVGELPSDVDDVGDMPTDAKDVRVPEDVGDKPLDAEDASQKKLLLYVVGPNTISSNRIDSKDVATFRAIFLAAEEKRAKVWSIALMTWCCIL